MPSATPKHILTAPAWPYANGPRHIGHVSGFAIPSDMFSRYQRMAGNKVLMVSGTDEHGTPNHHYAVVQEIFSTLLRNGYIFPKTALGAISPSTGRTLPDRYIEGTCPICGYGEARGDQCDHCGNQLDPTDLLNPRSRINGETPEFVETQHFFLDLPALAEALSTWLDGREASGTWRPNVIRFSRNILAEIKPRAMTRDR